MRDNIWLGIGYLNSFIMQKREREREEKKSVPPFYHLWFLPLRCVFIAFGTNKYTILNNNKKSSRNG